VRPCVSVGSQTNWMGIDPSQMTFATGFSDVVCMVIVGRWLLDGCDKNDGVAYSRLLRVLVVQKR
jgi:hypothetical protein